MNLLGKGPIKSLVPRITKRQPGPGISQGWTFHTIKSRGDRGYMIAAERKISKRRYTMKSGDAGEPKNAGSNSESTRV